MRNQQTVPLRATPRAVATLATMTLLAACDFSADVAPVPRLDGGEMFQRTVAIGNSITAGFQSGGINDSTQRESFALYLAHQVGLAVGPTSASDYVYPSFPLPGCPAPIANFATQARVGAPNNPPCTLRAATTALINNVAVPGATVADPTSTAGNPTSGALNLFILGGRSQVERALMTRPTFATVWIGNNDVLAQGLGGLVTPPTPVAAFQQSYDAMIAELTTNAPGTLRGVLIGVVQVANVPLLFPVAAFDDPQFKAGFDQLAGRVPTSSDPFKSAELTILPNCLLAPTTRVNLQLAAQIAAFRNDSTQPPASRAGHPPVISCGSAAPLFPAPVGDAGILTPAEQTTLAGVIDAYNAFIRAKASEIGFAYYDPNPLLLAQRAPGGCINVVPNLAAIPAGGNPFGPCISLDGIHPARQAHVLVANQLIGVINAAYDTEIPPVDAATGSRPVPISTLAP